MPTDAMIERARKYMVSQYGEPPKGFIVTPEQCFEVMAEYSEADNRDLRQRLEAIERTLRDAVTLRGSAWVIRYEEHGYSGPGYYAMHDLWEGGSIGPYSTIIEADRAITEALSKISPVTEAATEKMK